MSIDVMKLVWDSSEHAETDLVVMLALADMSNIDGYCYPSIPTLAQRARRQVRSMINTLERIGASGELFIDKSRGRNHHNRYVITIGMSKEKLAQVLTKYMDYDPTTAVNAANEYFAKHAVERKNVQSTACFNGSQNVQSATQNVQSATLKHAVDCTRSVIEPSNDPKEEYKREQLPTSPPSSSPSSSTGDPLMDAAKNKASRGGRSFVSWQAEMNLKLEPAKRVPLVNAIGKACGLTALMNTKDTVLYEVHDAACWFYEHGYNTTEKIEALHKVYLSDDWKREKHPRPKLETFMKFASSQLDELPTVPTTNGVVTVDWANYGGGPLKYMEE